MMDNGTGMIVGATPEEMKAIRSDKMKAREMTKEKEQELLEKFKNSKSDVVLIKEQSMKAREMFEKLNYLIDEGENHLNYWKRKGNETGSWTSNMFSEGAEIQILFNKENKTIEKIICDIEFGKFIDGKFIFEPVAITLDELNAINKQIEELGWTEW